MAAFTITITNSINLFGPAPSNKWNQYSWNSFKWGEGTNGLPKDVAKVVDNSLTLDSSVGKTAKKTVTNALTVTVDMHSETLRDSSGYLHVFPSNVTEGESRAIPSWSQGSAGSSSWSQAAASSTSWSAA